MKIDLKTVLACLQNGEFQKAQELAGAITDDEPANADAWHLKGVAALNRNQSTEAVGHLQQAAQLRPNDARILSNLAAALIAAKRTEDAQRMIAQALDIDPTFAQAHYQQALIYLE